MAKANTTTQTHLILDYPKPKELITSSHYSFRIAASDDVKTLEIIIDGGPAQQTRQASGYHWFDWSNYMSGRHEVTFQVEFQDGSVETTEPRRVHVELETPRS
jgi:hypothetical protein